MLIIKFIIILIMFCGLLCTLAPRFHGTVIILLAGSSYALINPESSFGGWVAVSLVTLTFLAEVGIRWLRLFLTAPYKVSRMYSTNTTVCNLAGIIVISTLLRSIIGMTIWEVIVGKTLLPRLDSIGKVLLRLFLTASLRFVCGLIMIIIILRYVMV